MIKTPRVLLVIALVLLTLGLMIGGCSSNSSNTSTRVTVGEPAPDFELENLDGESVSLSDYIGRPVLINFWRVNCPPCRDEIPHLQAVYSERLGGELVMLMINAGESPGMIRSFLNDNEISFPVLLDPDIAVAVTYGIPGVPTTFFIDRDGIIQAKVIGPLLTTAAIESRISQIMP